jgi:serine/threonine-protein kinase
VGSGASAHVYVAEDVRLKRRVALKVLHPVLAEDRSFLRRFEMEAQLVASLRHPGIVRVYDWGEEGGDAYLAMELLDGGSLRGLLDTGYRLSVSQAAALGVDVAAALAHAHARGLVHRDIKPANLLFDEEGRSSVADFGIARALAEASWTEPMGALVGTARYAAPEQLQGVALDGRADVYALALVLVECVTGMVPFARDTILGALMARASQPLPVPAELGALAGVLEGAGTPSPDDRLSAEELAEQIAVVARQLRAPARLPVHVTLPAAPLESPDPTELGTGAARPADAGPTVLVDDLEIVAAHEVGEDLASAMPEGAVQAGGAGTTGDSDGQASAMAAATADGEPPATVEPAAPPVSAGDRDLTVAGAQPPAPSSVRPAPPAGPAHGDGPAVASSPSGKHRGARRRELRGRRRRRWPRRLAVLVLVACVLGGGATAAVLLTRPAPVYAVPSLSGESPGAAAASLHARHLRLAVAGRQWSPSTPSGEVMSQFPRQGARVHAKTVVAVTLSLGPQPVAVPSLSTLDLAQVRSVLHGQQLQLGTVARRSSMTVPAGTVISWSDAGHELLPGSKVDVVVSTGKPMVTVPPGADGSSYTHLAAQLAALHLAVHELQEYSNTVPEGTVIATSPAPGSSQVVGTEVTVTVSLGPHMVSIPSAIVGMTQGQATDYLLKLGIYVSGVQGSPLAAVTGSVPTVGTSILYGKSITLVAG